MKDYPQKKINKKIINNFRKNPSNLYEFISQNKKYLKKFYSNERNFNLLMQKIIIDIEKLKEEIKILESIDSRRSKIKIKKEYLNNLEKAKNKLKQINFKK